MNVNRMKPTPLVMLNIFSAFLFLYTAPHTWDITYATAPGHLIPPWIVAAAAVITLDGGIFFWLEFFTKSAKTIEQRYVSGIILLINYIGLLTVVVMDVLYRTEIMSLELSLSQGMIASLSVPIMVMINLAAFVLAKGYSPEIQSEINARLAEMHIESQVVQQEMLQSEALARRIAPSVATGRLQARLGDKLGVDVQNELKREELIPADLTIPAEDVRSPLP